MYKFENKEQSSVSIPSKGMFSIHPGTYEWQKYEDWLAEGGVTEPWKTEEELLQDAKQLKQNEILQSYKQADDAPYTIGDLVYAGGFNSAMMLEKAESIAIRLNRENARTYDVNLIRRDVPVHSEIYPDIKDIVESLALRSEEYIFKLNNLLVAIAMATTIEEVNAIKW